MSRRSATVSVLALFCLPLTLAVSVTAAEGSEPGYGDAMTVTFGTNVDSQVPLSVDLPAPAGGTAVTQLIVSWTQQPAPTWGGVSSGRLLIDTPDCVAAEPCHVEASVPTSRILNGSPQLNVAAFDGTQTLGGTTRQVVVNNPKPTVLVTSPHFGPVWGPFEVTADASPSSPDVPLLGVRFYVNPTGQESDPYVLDTTAPYSISLDSSDLAAVGSSGTVYAVAEDVQGNLSLYDGSNDMRAYLTVAPPAEVTWTSPGGPGRPVGSMSTQALLAWSARIPDSAPDTGGQGNDYIKNVELDIDGVKQLNMPYDKVSWYTDGKHHREISFSWFWDGMTPGLHTGQLVVTTGWGSVATADTEFIVTDGVDFSPVTSHGRTVRNGFLVTAGDVVPLSVTATGHVAGSALQWWDINQDGSSINGLPPVCTRADWWNCPNQVTLAGRWGVPQTPGDYTLRFQVQGWGDDVPVEITRTFHVQAAGRLSAHVSDARVISGQAIRVGGRLVRVDTGAGVARVKVVLQWKPRHATRWRAVLSRRTNSTGRVAARPTPPRSGSYRWVTAGDPGRISGARSAGVRVHVE